jgi:hypothetical protein
VFSAYFPLNPCGVGLLQAARLQITGRRFKSMGVAQFSAVKSATSDTSRSKRADRRSSFVSSDLRAVYLDDLVGGKRPWLLTWHLQNTQGAPITLAGRRWGVGHPTLAGHVAMLKGNLLTPILGRENINRQSTRWSSCDTSSNALYITSTTYTFTSCHPVLPSTLPRPTLLANPRSPRGFRLQSPSRPMGSRRSNRSTSARWIRTTPRSSPSSSKRSRSLSGMTASSFSRITGSLTSR